MKYFCFIPCFSFVFILSILFIDGIDLSILGDRVHNETSDLVARELFKEFVITHNRTYVDDPMEYSERMAIFKESLARHAKLNAREHELDGTATYGINQFSDWTKQEFREFLRKGSSGGYGVLTTGNEIYQGQTCKFCGLNLNVSDVPYSQDWTKKGKVTAVNNQGKCGSCWAFTATECVESQWAIAGNTLTELSVQELISCSKKHGCSGGNTLAALSWLQDMGYTLAPASEFPYVDKENVCKTSLLKQPGARIRCGCQLIFTNKTHHGELDMKMHVGLHGPLAVNVDATMWHDYLGGIIQHHCTDTDINHAVQITGYDFNGFIWYWIVRNSWGSSFGENGYLRIKMGDNLCGVADSPSYVVV